jgi:hypothetical protein
MNTSDPSAARIIEKRAPILWDWLQTIHGQGARGFADGEAPTRDHIEALTPLLEEIVRIHVPLMEQNERAYERYKAKGQTRFNESAFWRGESLYDGELLGRPFRSVVKTFQVKIWRDLKAHYSELRTDHRSALPPSVCAAFEPT